MIFTKKYLAVLVLCVAFHSVADDTVQVSKSPDLSSLQNPDVVAKFLERVDVVIHMLNTENIDVARAASVANQIEARTQFNLIKQSGGKDVKFSPTARSRAAMNLLSPTRYAAIEDACVVQLKSSNEVTRALSIRILSQSLGSVAGKNHMLNTLNKSIKELSDDDKLSISSKELFAVAEGLAFIEESDGVEILKSVLSSNGSPSFLKYRAIKALDYLGIPFSSEIVSNLLLSDDVMVVYTAFDSMELQYTNRIVLSAAITQMQRLQIAYTTKQTLSHNQAALLAKMALILKLASREGVLSGAQLRDIKTAVNLLVSVHNANIQERVGSLFAELAQDEDIELIQSLLASDSARVRSRAALAISHCSQNIIQEQKEVLITLLDDKSDTVRNFALYALRKGLGEKASNYLSDAEYKSQKARVLARYAR